MFRLTQDGGVARLTLDRPEARNAIPAAGWAELAGQIEAVRESGARLLVVSGSNSAFCAGADLADFAGMREDEPARTQFRTEMRAALDRLSGLSCPTIAYVEGPCFGAGVALAIACDIRMAGKNARFAITPAKIGISYLQEDIHRLVALVGPGQAARLLFSSVIVGGKEAQQIGLVEYQLPEPSLERLVKGLLANDPESLCTLKRGIRLAAANVRQDEEQDRRFDDLLGGDALARGLEALRRK